MSDEAAGPDRLLHPSTRLNDTMHVQLTNIKKKVAAVVAGLAIAGAVGASAASLGGLDSESLGADTGDVAACDTNGIDVEYTNSYDMVSGEYLVDSVTLSDISFDCLFQPYEFSIFEKGATGARYVQGGPFLFFFNFEISPNGEWVGSWTWTVDFPAESLEGVALQIGGRTVGP